MTRDQRIRSLRAKIGHVGRQAQAAWAKGDEDEHDNYARKREALRLDLAAELARVERGQ
jgi:hypothetical protein